MGFFGDFARTWRALKDSERLAKEKVANDLLESQKALELAQLELAQAKEALVKKEEKVEELVKRDRPDFTAEREKATSAGEPWVKIVHIEVDPENLTDGVFELDWNDLFVARLIRSGYQGKNDQEIVDQWFNVICSNVVAGNFEQELADPEKRKIIQRKLREDGKTEIG